MYQAFYLIMTVVWGFLALSSVYNNPVGNMAYFYCFMMLLNAATYSSCKKA